MTPTRTENVVREFPAVGKYRIRLIEKTGGRPVLDIREYISNSGSFEGFTRRGIRIVSAKEAEVLFTALSEIVDCELLAAE